MITGQLIMRDAGSADSLLPGENKKLMMVFGIVAVPNDTKLQGEHQYVVAGTDNAGVVQLEVPLRGALDVSEHTRGNSPGGIMRKPIWRV